MKPLAAVAVLIAVLFAAPRLFASGPVGIYGIVERVVFEPSEQAPERIQVWGAFAIVDSTLARLRTIAGFWRSRATFRLSNNATFSGSKATNAFR